MEGSSEYAYPESSERGWGRFFWTDWMYKCACFFLFFLFGMLICPSLTQDRGPRPSSFSENDSTSSIAAHFCNSSSATGTLLIETNRLHSRVRTTLLSHDLRLAENSPSASSASTSSIPLVSRSNLCFFQGRDPQAGACEYVRSSFLDTTFSQRA